jgi:hypothetical protein
MTHGINGGARLAAGGVMVLTLGCVGRLGGPGQKAPPPATQGPPPAALAAKAPPAGPASFRRLTRLEYNNTIRDLLGDASEPANELPGDTTSEKSGFVKGGPVSRVDAEHFVEITEALAARAAKHLGDFLPCAPTPTAAEAQARCAQDFIARFGRRAYRRPLTAAEGRALFELYARQRTKVKHDFPNAIRVVMTAMLLSPSFLYRWELAPHAAIHDGAVLRFNPYETASRLSYFLWASMPDEPLFAAAAAGKLETPEQIGEQARRLLKDPRARDGVGDFFVQWLDVAGLPEARKSRRVYRPYSKALVESMLAESRTFATSLILEGDADLQILLTGTVSYVDEGLAKLYGVQGVTGPGLRPVALPAGERAGILTHASFLAMHATGDQSHPVKRGVEVLQRVLCLDLPLPPDNVPDPKQATADTSTRERFAEHGKNACATDCHDLIDPLGFAFEHYDAVGAYRALDGGKPVDASGSLTADGKDKAFEDAVDLMGFLARSQEVHDCMAQQWLRYALRRKEVAADGPSLEAVKEVFRRTSDLRELMVAITETRAFTHRAASAGEALH